MRSRTVTLIGLVLVAAFLAGTTTPALGALPTWLTSTERTAIRHAPHPYLRTQCVNHNPIVVRVARRTTIGTHHVIVAQVMCKYGTSGAPVETSVYGHRDGAWHELYRLESGRVVQRPRYWITAVQSLRLHGRRVVLPYDGYRASDALCCPSRRYHRVFHLRWGSFTRGALVRDN